MNDIFKEELKGVQVQVKPLKNKQGSRSITLHNVDVDEVFSRIEFMFQQLARDEEVIVITHYKRRKEDETVN